jgi:hypothetical protein
MYPVQASLKQLQFLYNWSTEVPEQSSIESRTEKRLEQEGIAAGSQIELKWLLVNTILCRTVFWYQMLIQIVHSQGHPLSSDQCERTQVGLRLALEVSHHGPVRPSHRLLGWPLPPRPTSLTRRSAGHRA